MCWVSTWTYFNGLCFDKETADGALKSRNMSNKELAAELQKPIIRKFEQQKVYSTFLENIWGAYLTHMQLISNYYNYKYFSKNLT